MSASSPSSLQPYIDQVGSYAKTSTPAYSLAALFALVAPFSFPGGRDKARIAAPSPTSPLGKALGAQLRSPSAVRSALPPFWQLAGFATFFGAGGYIIDQGDSLNGAGTVTGESVHAESFTVLHALNPSSSSSTIAAVVCVHQPGHSYTSSSTVSAPCDARLPCLLL